MVPRPRQMKKEVGRLEASAFMWIPSSSRSHLILLVKQAVNDRIHRLFLSFGLAPTFWRRRISSVCRLCASSHINRRTQFENPVLEAKRRLQHQQMQCQGLSSLPLPAIYRGERAPVAPVTVRWTVPVTFPPAVMAALTWGMNQGNLL